MPITNYNKSKAISFKEGNYLNGNKLRPNNWLSTKDTH
jgi:hypothetical protein